MRKREAKLAFLCTFCASMLLQSCVDDDYDLSKDIDLTVQVGGDWELPISSTENMTMADILDLDDESIVQPESGTNIYTLRKDAASSEFDFTLDKIDVEEQLIDPFQMAFILPDKEDFLTQIGLTVTEFDKLKDLPESSWPDNFKKAMNDTYTSTPINLDVAINALSFIMDMPYEVIELKYAGFDKMNPNIGLSTDLPTGALLNMHKVNVDFPQDLDYLDIGEGEWNVVDDVYRYTLPDRINISSNSSGNVSVSFRGLKCNYKKTESPEMKYDFNKDITMRGQVTVTATGRQLLLGNSPMAGKKFNLIATMSLGEMVVGEVTAIVDPQIDDDVTYIELNDLPDFLTEDGVKVYLQNPMIRLNAQNTSPLPVNAWGVMKPKDKNGNYLLEQEVAVSVKGSDAIQIADNSSTDYYIYAGDKPEKEGYKYYNAPGLSNLIATVPNVIDIDFAAQVNQEFYTIRLGESYEINMDYKIECPLAFKKGSQIVYADTIADWNEDIEDVEAKELVISAVLLNKTSLDELDLVVTPIDVNGQRIEGIKVDEIKGKHDGDDIEFTLLCTDTKYFKQLDGIIVRVTAKVTQENSAPLKSDDTIKLDNIKATIKGGIIVDLN